MAQNSSLRLFYKHIFLMAELFFACVQGDCNVCSPTSGLVCVSGNEFQVCVADIPTGNINTCPSGTVCSSNGSRICQEPGPHITEDCQDCNSCDSTNTFACTGPSKYVLCLGSASHSQLEGFCKPNHVCNRNNPYICEDTTVGGVASCPSDIIQINSIENTPKPDPVNFCRATKQNGRFPIGLDTAPTCRQYFYCFLSGGTWRGQLYKCPGRTYFNGASRLCDPNVPPDCV